jgi:DNA-binding LacI/PurR family transcriptional regulator
VEITEVAIGTLLDQIESGKPATGRRQAFEAKLVIRNSCANTAERAGVKRSASGNPELP